MAIFLTEGDVEKLVTMPDALRLVETAFRDFGDGEAQNQPRQRIRAPQGVMHVMPAGWFGGGYMGFKAYSSFHGNARFHFHLFDSKTGDYLAIIEANRLGQIRTGAASGVATKFLARREAKTLGIIGTGYQAETQMEAVCLVRKFEVVKCFSREEKNRNDFAAKMSERCRVRVEPVATAQAAVMASDVVVTMTSAAHPVLQGEWLSSGAHVNVTGSNWALRREVDGATLKRAHAIFADSVEDSRVEAGDLILGVAENAIGWHQVQELGALVSGRAVGRASNADITVFKSSGVALEDVAVGSFVFEHARELGIGVALPI